MSPQVLRLVLTPGSPVLRSLLWASPSRVAEKPQLYRGYFTFLPSFFFHIVKSSDVVLTVCLRPQVFRIPVNTSMAGDMEKQKNRPPYVSCNVPRGVPSAPSPLSSFNSTFLSGPLPGPFVFLLILPDAIFTAPPTSSSSLYPRRVLLKCAKILLNDYIQYILLYIK